jgi:methylenetetrahydrofolate reductase (NADPH)
VRDQLAQLKAMGVKRIVALRGDLPSGYGMGGEFQYASELVEFIRAETGSTFRIEVACYPEVHPQAKSPQSDLQAFAAKVKAGADSAITQYFYNADSYFRFVDEARKLGVDVPVVPGIMPITNSSQLLRFSDACGAEIPRWIRLRLQASATTRRRSRPSASTW